MTERNRNSLFRLGAAYYPDYIEDGALARSMAGKIAWLSWSDRIKEDLERMSADGLSVIRMGEFCWSSVEPARGIFQFERFHTALEQCQKHQIQVIFCTPTATPPKWLIDQYPDILPVTREGRTIPFGTRRHYDACNEHYLEEVQRITRAFAQEFGNHPSVIGWQIDNEYGCHNSLYSFTTSAKAAFQNWLEKTYSGDIDCLNRDWFTCFWSQGYASFAEIDLPYASWADQNPHMELYFRRFFNDVYGKFQRAQSSIIRELSPGRFVTHNLMSLFTDLCPWQLCTDLDVVGFDHYQMTEVPGSHTSAWQFSLMRSLKDQPFIVLEQQPLQVNWQPVNRQYSYDWLFLWGLQSAFRGAMSMYYFSWQRMYGGAEQYHEAIVPHDVRVPESWQERVIRSKNEFFQLLQERFGLSSMPEPTKDVLCLHNFESLWTHEITSQSVQYSTHEMLDFVSDLCSSAAYGLHFAQSVEESGESLFLYKLLILPGYAFEFSAREKRLLRQFIDRGGKVLSLPRTAFKRKNSQMSAKPLDLFGDDFYFEDFGALGADEVETVSIGDSTITGIRWIECVRLLSPNWMVAATFKSGMYQGAPAAIVNATFNNDGIYMHLAFCPESNSQTIHWLLQTLSLAKTAEQTANRPIQLLPLTQGARQFLSAINFENNEQSFNLTRGYRLLLVASLDHNQQLKTSEHPTEALGEGAVGNRQTITLPARHAAFAELLPAAD